LWLCVIVWWWYKKGNSSLAKTWQLQNIIISTRGIAGHNVGLLFTVYVIVGNTCYSNMLVLEFMHIVEGNTREKIA